MNLASNALTTVEQVKSFLSIDVDDTDNDDLIKFFINASSEFIEKYTSRKFGFVESANVTMSGQDVDRLYLPYRKVGSISSLSQDGTVMSASSYALNPATGVVMNKNGVFANGFSNYVIGVVDAGFVLPKDDSEETPRDLPYDLELACVKLVARVFNKRDAEGASQASAGSLNVNWLQEMDKDTMSILNSYKIMHV